MEYSPVSNLFHRNWNQKEQEAVVKKPRSWCLMCLVDWVIRLMLAEQAEDNFQKLQSKSANKLWILPESVEKLLWASWELKTGIVPNTVHKGNLSFRIMDDYEHLLAHWYLNDWRCTNSCVLGILFLSSSLISRYILVMRVGDIISARIDMAVKI